MSPTNCDSNNCHRHLCSQKKNLDIDLYGHSCATFDITSENFPWPTQTIVILCFDEIGRKFCFSYDGDVPGELTEIAESNFGHWTAGLTRYKQNLMTVGGIGWDGSHQNTELMERNKNGNFTWSVIESDFIFTPSQKISYHSLITIPASYKSEEYVLLIGGLGGQAVDYGWASDYGHVITRL